MVETIVTMFLWSLITNALLTKGDISLEYASIGMCVMLAAVLLHKEE